MGNFDVTVIHLHPDMLVRRRKTIVQPRPFADGLDGGNALLVGEMFVRDAHGKRVRSQWTEKWRGGSAANAA